MPLGKTPLLQMETMAQGDNNKYVLFNDAVAALEDSVNRSLNVDLSGGDVALTESQFLRYGLFKGTGHAVARNLTIPTTVGSSPTVTTNRLFLVRNAGTDIITVTHGSGATVDVPAGAIVIVYADGTDITSALEAPNPSVSDDGSAVHSAPSDINFEGVNVGVADDGDGTVTVTVNNRLNVVEETGASRSLTLADIDTVVQMNNAGANSYTLEPDATVNAPIGSSLHLIQRGAGQTTVVAGTGVTVLTPATLKTRVQNSLLTAVKLAADLWVVSGDLEAAP